MRKATLILSDGSRFCGESFGFEKPVAGEVVFNTAMSGYPESLTDPSYAGQLMTLTYPLVGNYGVPPFTIEENGVPTFMESERIHAEAIIVSDYSQDYSHWNAVESLADWLKREQVPGITLANFIRSAYEQRGNKISLYKFRKLLRQQMEFLQSENRTLEAGRKKHLIIIAVLVFMIVAMFIITILNISFRLVVV